MNLIELRAAHEADPCDLTACVAYLTAVAEAPCETCGGEGTLREDPLGEADSERCDACSGTGKGSLRTVEALLSATEPYKCEHSYGGDHTKWCEHLKFQAVLPALRLLADWEDSSPGWNAEDDHGKTAVALDCLLRALARLPGGTKCPACDGKGGPVQWFDFPVPSLRDAYVVRVPGTDCQLCCGSGSLGIVAGICKRCGKPAERHFRFQRDMWHGLFCKDTQAQWRQRQMDPLACPFPPEAR